LEEQPFKDKYEGTPWNKVAIIGAEELHQFFMEKVESVTWRKTRQSH